ncbi:Rhodanese-like protein [Thioalkalivibrio nitratireducens DSM 14787]|uniref:Rhodanese-like protein n=1 Tax=Thioalkalivibrio nitratireducens (strain DSM 14787 / UNIQEM 213 / ALEN2) TaxID=1255043 RepID=L0DWN8_THIND|nr:rhodanese-like domain-containing protein [Thioalkalivibrio nitratireducens]AGA33453.1 Rhodanese-like protein [Thioalkalivibrio nitratireducens DSM 14787]
MMILDTIRSWWPFGAVPEVSAEELRKLSTRGGVQIVDVRTRLEFRYSRIPGARSLPITHFTRSGLRSLDLDPGRPVVAVCLTAHRSVPAVRILRRQGYDARQLRAGMRAWWRAGLPCETG